MVKTDVIHHLTGFCKTLCDITLVQELLSDCSEFCISYVAGYVIHKGHASCRFPGLSMWAQVRVRHTVRGSGQQPFAVGLTHDG